MKIQYVCEHLSWPTSLHDGCSTLCADREGEGRVVQSSGGRRHVFCPRGEAVKRERESVCVCE